jgi:hypothetical protein
MGIICCRLEVYLPLHERDAELGMGGLVTGGYEVLCFTSGGKGNLRYRRTPMGEFESDDT